MAYRAPHPLPPSTVRPDGCTGLWSEQLWLGRRKTTELPCDVYTLHTIELWWSDDVLVRTRSVPGRSVKRTLQDKLAAMIGGLGKDRCLEMIERETGIQPRREQQTWASSTTFSGLAHRYWSAAQYVGALLWDGDEPLLETRWFGKGDDKAEDYLDLEWWLRRGRLAGYEQTLGNLRKRPVEYRQALRALVLWCAEKRLGGQHAPWPYWLDRFVARRRYWNKESEMWCATLEPRTISGLSGSPSMTAMLIRGALSCDKTGWPKIESMAMNHDITKRWLRPWEDPAEPMPDDVRTRIAEASEISAPRPYLSAEMNRWALYGLHRWPKG